MTFSNPPVPGTVDDQLVSILRDHPALNRETTGTTIDLADTGTSA